jgi:uncharacterized protein (DUF2141 family)
MTPTAATAACLLLSLLGLASAASSADSETLTAGGGITLTIDDSDDAGTLLYSVAVDGADWLKSGPVAMTSGGVTYTTECASKDKCLLLSAKPTKTSGTDVSLPRICNLPAPSPAAVPPWGFC